MFEKYTDLETALVMGSIASLAVADEDSFFGQLVSEAGEHEFELFLFQGSEKIFGILNALWLPILNEARKKNEIREGVSDNEIIEWIMNIHAMLQIRDDYSPRKKKQVIKKFLVPSVLCS